jgi:hypothetical protein
MNSKCKLNTENEKPLKDINQFQRLVGKLIYLTVTILDISYSISQISKFMHSPRTSHLDAIDRILRYLKSTPGMGIHFKNNNSNEYVAIPMQIGLKDLIRSQLPAFALLYAEI